MDESEEMTMHIFHGDFAYLPTPDETAKLVRVIARQQDVYSVVELCAEGVAFVGEHVEVSRDRLAGIVEPCVEDKFRMRANAQAFDKNGLPKRHDIKTSGSRLAIYAFT